MEDVMKMPKISPKAREVIDLFGPMEIVALAVFLATLLVWAATIRAVGESYFRSHSACASSFSARPI